MTKAEERKMLAIEKIKVSENIFVLSAKEIRDISIKENKDIGVALDMYCINHGLDYNKYAVERDEFKKYCRICTLNEIIEIREKSEADA